jgi:hypothetical protein
LIIFYHKKLQKIKLREKGDAASSRAIPFIKTKLLAFLVFALLICNTAAGFASGLARSLALTAATVLCAFAKVASFDRFDMFHFG